MGTAGSKFSRSVVARSDVTDRCDDFVAFSKRLSETITQIVQFIGTNLPSIQRTRSRLFHLDARLAIISNMATRLRELDILYPHNIPIVRLFDRILQVLWTTIQRRYHNNTPVPGSQGGPTNITPPCFLAEQWPGNAYPYSMMRDIVLVVELLMQASGSLVTYTTEEVGEIRGDTPTSILSLASHTIKKIHDTINSPSSILYFGTPSQFGVEEAIMLVVSECERSIEEIRRIDLTALHRRDIAEATLPAAASSSSANFLKATTAGGKLSSSRRFDDSPPLRHSHSLPDVRDTASSGGGGSKKKSSRTTSSQITPPARSDSSDNVAAPTRRPLSRATSVPVTSSGPLSPHSQAATSNFIRISMTSNVTSPAERSKKISPPSTPLAGSRINLLLPPPSSPTPPPLPLTIPTSPTIPSPATTDAEEQIVSNPPIPKLNIEQSLQQGAAGTEADTEKQKKVNSAPIDIEAECQSALQIADEFLKDVGVMHTDSGAGAKVLTEDPSSLATSPSLPLAANADTEGTPRPEDHNH